MSGSSSVGVVIVAHGSEPTLGRCVDALLASRGVDLDVVIVDNVATADDLEPLRSRSGVRVVGEPRNRGFTGGTALGAREVAGDVVVLLNSDAFVEPDALARLATVATQPEVGIATASVRLADRPELLNSAGNPVHYSGLGWSGAFEEPARDHADAVDVAAASGALMAIRRELWTELDGFAPDLFAYLEDAELSLRCWQQGLAVRYVPDAVVLHDYEFGRHPTKFYLLERNRLYLLLTTYELRTLVLLAPALVLVELAMLVQALAGGWAGAKLRGWWWLLRHPSRIARRRRWVQARRTVPDGIVARRLSARIEPANVDAPPGMGLLNAVLAGWWALVRPLLRTTAGTESSPTVGTSASRAREVR